jgi:hypothetical protein
VRDAQERAGVIRQETPLGHEENCSNLIPVFGC